MHIRRGPVVCHNYGQEEPGSPQMATASGGVRLRKAPGDGAFIEWDEIPYPYDCDSPPEEYPRGDPFSFLVERAHRIDIKPGSDPNGINPRSKGKLPVAILTDEGFEAQLVAPDTVLFGPADAAAVKWHFEDSDGDGDVDMVRHSRTSESGIACGETLARLEGKTQGGEWFNGMDFVKTPGCK